MKLKKIIIKKFDRDKKIFKEYFKMTLSVHPKPLISPMILHAISESIEFFPLSNFGIFKETYNKKFRKFLLSKENNIILLKRNLLSFLIISFILTDWLIFFIGNKLQLSDYYFQKFFSLITTKAQFFDLIMKSLAGENFCLNFLYSILFLIILSSFKIPKTAKNVKIKKVKNET